MSLAADADVSYRWSVETFVQAWDAGVFGQPVELVEGELLTVPIGAGTAEPPPVQRAGCPRHPVAR